MNERVKPSQELTQTHREPDDDVPASERGKDEEMSLEERQPSAVFGIVGLSYLVILLVLIVLFVLYWLL